MNEPRRNPGEDLLAVDAGTVPETDPRQLTLTALIRDRRRVRLLAWLAVFFWLLSAAGMLCATYVYFEPLTTRTDHILMRLDENLNKPLAERRQYQEEMFHALRQVARVLMWFVSGCIFAAALAAFCTVWLVLSSRRSTLRQVNANLLQISRQLSALRQGDGAVRGAGS